MLVSLRPCLAWAACAAELVVVAQAPVSGWRSARELVTPETSSGPDLGSENTRGHLQSWSDMRVICDYDSDGDDGYNTVIISPTYNNQDSE